MFNLHLLFFFSVGHGPVIKEKSLEKIEEYISHRNKREKEIYDVLQDAFLVAKFEEQNTTHEEKIKNQNDDKNKNKRQIFDNEKFQISNAEYRSSWEIMLKVYGSLPIFVKISAQWNCLHHLNKLLKENKVCYRWPDLWKVNDEL